MSASKSKVVIGTLLIFALGVLVGAFGANMYLKYRMDRLFSKGEPPRVVQLFMNRLSSKLDLTKEQRQKIEVIVKRSHKEFRAVKEKYRPEIEAIMDKTFAEIENVLNEEQKPKLEEFRKNLHFYSGHKKSSAARSSKPLDRIAQRFLQELDQQLNLTEDQQLQVQEIVENHVAQLRELFKTARDEGRPETGAFRAALENLNQETEQRLRTVLTEEQMITYKKIWDEQRRELWAEMSQQTQEGRERTPGVPR